MLSVKTSGSRISALPLEHTYDLEINELVCIIVIIVSSKYFNEALVVGTLGASK